MDPDRDRGGVRRRGVGPPPRSGSKVVAADSECKMAESAECGGGGGPIRLSSRPFDCGPSALAALSVSIGAERVEAIRSAVERRFGCRSSSDFVDFVAASTTMQLHDGELNEFTVRPLHSDSNGPPLTLCPVHCDLRSASSPKETVYGVMVRRRERDEWRWTMDD